MCGFDHGINGVRRMVVAVTVFVGKQRDGGRFIHAAPWGLGVFKGGKEDAFNLGRRRLFYRILSPQMASELPLLIAGNLAITDNVVDVGHGLTARQAIDFFTTEIVIHARAARQEQRGQHKGERVS